MKTVYIPRGESRSYTCLITDNLIVNGHLNVENELKAKHISGCGVIAAGRVSADEITADEIETSSIVCTRLMAKRVSAAEVFASDCAVVSCFLEASYVETGRLTTALSEVGEVEADEVIQLVPKKRSMILTLIMSALRSFWLTLTAPPEREESTYMSQHYEEAAEDGDGDSESPEDDTEYPDICEEIARTVREVMEEEIGKVREQEKAEDAEDGELKRFISIFKLLREQGYTLRVVPGTPEENAPVFDFEKNELTRPAA